MATLPNLSIRDSRRITGLTLVLDRPGAVFDVQLDEPQRSRAIAAWRRTARGLLDALGWDRETLGVRLFQGGASLALSAPVDALYAATEVNEWAWEAAVAELQGEPAANLADAAETLR